MAVWQVARAPVKEKRAAKKALKPKAFNVDIDLALSAYANSRQVYGPPPCTVCS
jgi:hypothetical protein